MNQNAKECVNLLSHCRRAAAARDLPYTTWTLRIMGWVEGPNGIPTISTDNNDYKL